MAKYQIETNQENIEGNLKKIQQINEESEKRKSV